MNQPEILTQENALTKTVMPSKHNRFDIPAPIDHKIYLNWAIEGSNLYLDLRQQSDKGVYNDNKDDSLFNGMLSPTNTELDFNLDLTMPNPLPHFNLDDGKITLIHEGMKPTGLKVEGTISISHHSIGHHEYTFSW